MPDLSIPPSPNWYLSQIVDCAEDGRLVYGARESIVLFDCEKSTTSVISCAHAERVTSVQFAPVAAGNKVVSSGEDFVVRIWDLDTRQAVLTHIVHTNSQRTPVACWSRADPNLVVSADARGYIVSWDLHTNLTRTFEFKLSFTTVSSSPHNKNVIALGTKTGLVYVMDIMGKGRVLHKLRGHDVEIVSLAWCPVKENIFKPSEEDTCLLASGARDKSIYLWRAASDGRYEKEINLPTAPFPNSGHRTQLPGNYQQSGSWTAICWAEPNTLVAASPWGELIAYDLLKERETQNSAGRENKKSNNWRLLHGKHSRGLFAIACKPHSCAKSEDDSQEEVVLWTVAQDRQVVSYSATSGKVLRAILTLGGPVYCMALSPIDGSRLAVGVGDKSIRIWNLTDPNPDSMVFFWNKIAGRVYAVAWHPTKEGCLAYGTSDGRVGLYDTMRGKPPVLFRLHFLQSVYVLQWGPNINLRGAIGSGGPAYPEKREEPQEESTGKKADYLLYAIADNQACAFDPEKPSETPVKLKSILRSADAVGKIQMDRNRTALAWKPDFSLLAVGNEDGSVHLLAPHEPTGLRHIRTILVHSKYIQDLVWHPTSSGKDYMPSYSSWLGVASSDHEIRVLDVSELLGNLSDVNFDTSEIPVAVVATLKGHKQRVISLFWNPHIGGQLLSTSYDESAVVWDVPSEKPLHSFSGHSSVVLCGIWSPLETDLVITGSADATLRVWQISAQKEGAPDAKKKTKSFNGAKQALPDNSFDTSNEREKGGEQYRTEAGAVAVAKSVESLKQDKKKIKERSLFPVSSATMNESSHLLRNLERLLAFKGCANASNQVNGMVAVSNGDAPDKVEEKEDRKISISEELGGMSAFFGDKDAVAQLLDRERSALAQMDQFESAFTIDVWRSKIKDAVEEAAKKQKLTDHIVALSPMASMKVWQSACVAYAEQLCRTGEYVRSAGYYLAVHKVEEAVMMLLDHGLHRQAIAIAKSRLAAEDPFVKDAVRKWATQKIFEGQIEIATNCLASLEEWIEAADVLRRRRQIPHLCVAAQLASRGGAHEKAATIFLDSLRLNVDDHWPALTSCLANLPNQNHLKLLVAVYQLILRRFKEKLDPERWLKGTLKDDGPSFEFCVDGKSSGYVSGKIPISKQLRAPLQTLLASALSLSIRAEALLTVSIFVALAMTYSPKSFTELPEGFTCPEEDGSELDVHEAICKLVKAMEALSIFQLRDPESAHMLLKLCILLSPKGPTHPGSIFSERTVSPAQKSSRAYLCVGVLNWLMENGPSFIPSKVEVFPDRKPPLKGRRRLAGRNDVSGVNVKTEQLTDQAELRAQQTEQTSGRSSLLEEKADRSIEVSTDRTTTLTGESAEPAEQLGEAVNADHQRRDAEQKLSTGDIIDVGEQIVDNTGDKPEPSKESGDQKTDPSKESRVPEATLLGSSGDQKSETSESGSLKTELSKETGEANVEFTESSVQEATPTELSGDQKTELSIDTTDQESHTANHTAESTCETADEIASSMDRDVQDDQPALSADLTVASEENLNPVYYYKPAWIQALDLIKRCGDDVFSVSNLRYFSDSVRYKVLLHQEANATKDKSESKIAPAANSKETEREVGESKDEERQAMSQEKEDVKGQEEGKAVSQEGEGAKCQEGEGAKSQGGEGAMSQEGGAKSQGGEEEGGAKSQEEEEGAKNLEEEEGAKNLEEEEGAKNLEEEEEGAKNLEEEGAKNLEEEEGAKNLEEGRTENQEGETKKEDSEDSGPEGLLSGGLTLTVRQQEIKRLREWFVKFEKEQVVVPNPFVCYANLSLVLRETLMQVDQKQTEVYIEYFKKFWDEVLANKA